MIGQDTEIDTLRSNGKSEQLSRQDHIHVRIAMVPWRLKQDLGTSSERALRLLDDE